MVVYQKSLIFKINSLLFLQTFPDNTPKNQYFCKNHAKITITKSLLFPVIIISNTVKYYNSATKIKRPFGRFIFVLYDIGLGTGNICCPGSHDSWQEQAQKRAVRALRVVSTCEQIPHHPP